MFRRSALIAARRSASLRKQNQSFSSTVGDATFVGPSAPAPPPIQLVSRRALQKYKQQTKPNAKTKFKSTVDEEKPWPRNFVYAAYAATSIFIPYSTAWFLSTNKTLRSLIFSENDSSFLLNCMRRHFGVHDWESISEPESVQQPLHIPHKFVDEPTARIRAQQAGIDRRNQENVTVRLYHSVRAPGSALTASDSNGARVVPLPARTLARHEDIVQAVADVSIQPPVAIDFPLEQDATDDDAVLFHESDTVDGPNHSQQSATTVPSMSVYSLWHYHPPAASTSSDLAVGRMSETALERSRLDHEIQLLRGELSRAASSSRSVDDLCEELSKLQSAKRRLQRKEWIPWL